MRWFDAGRAMISAIAAVLLVVVALWLWPRSEALGGALSMSSAFGGSLVASTTPPLRLVQAVQAISIAAGAGGQALLLREVLPMFYTRRWMDELLHVVAGLIVVGGLLAGIVLLVESTG